MSESGTVPLPERAFILSLSVLTAIFQVNLG